MKLRLAAAKPFISLVVLILLFGTLAAFGQSGSEFSLDTSPLPAPTSPVNDYVGVFDPAAKAALEKRLIDYKTATGVEMAVAVVNTTGDRPILEYSLAVARGWGIGSKADDNPSALLFVAIDDRKYFTQVSRNLEDELPDGLVGSLQRQYLVPEFRNRNYAKGISDTIEAYIRTIDAKRSGTAAPTPESVGIPGMRRESGGGISLFCCLGIILLIVIILASSRGGKGGSGRRGGWGGGGGFGGGGGSVLPWIIGSAIANAASSSSSGNSWGGGSSDWGGSSGGGWGGFGGGGDFGGGGAGGDW